MLIAAEVAKRGHDAVIDDCLALLAGDTEPHRAQALAGARWAVYIDEHSSDLHYWLRVWALRGLLWEWDRRATDAVRDALGDPAWRVREMAAKVTARHLVGDAAQALDHLREDPVPRVRAAAERAIRRLIDAGA